MFFFFFWHFEDQKLRAISFHYILQKTDICKTRTKNNRDESIELQVRELMCFLDHQRLIQNFPWWYSKCTILYIHQCMHFLHSCLPSAHMSLGQCLSQHASGERQSTTWTGLQTVTALTPAGILELPILLTSMSFGGDRSSKRKPTDVRKNANLKQK